MREEFRSGECRDHSGSQRLLISLLGNRWSNHSIHFAGTIGYLDSHHDVFQVSPRTCSVHQCFAPLWQWLLLAYVFKSKWSDEDMFSDGHPAYEFHRVRGPLKHIVWGFCASVHTVIETNTSADPEVYFVVEPNSINENRILSRLVLEPLAITKCSFNISHIVKTCCSQDLLDLGFSAFLN